MAGNRTLDDPDDLLFASSVQARREAAGLTLSQFEVLVGIPRQTLHRIERGTRGVSRGEAIKIARAFGATVEEFPQVTALSAVKLHHLAGEVIRNLESDLHRDVLSARARMGDVQKLLHRAASEIDPEMARSEEMSRYLAEALNDAVYLLQELPTYLDSLERDWDGLQDLIQGSEPAKPASWAEELERARKRASQYL